MSRKVDKEKDKFTNKKQTKVPEQLIRKFRIQALTEGKEVREIYEEAIFDFFADRREHLKKGSALNLYNAPPGKGKLLNVQMGDSAAKEIEAIAEKDDSSGSKVIYTSLVKYAEKKGLL